MRVVLLISSARKTSSYPPHPEFRDVFFECFAAVECCAERLARANRTRAHALRSWRRLEKNNSEFRGDSRGLAARSTPKSPRRLTSPAPDAARRRLICLISRKKFKS